MARLMLRYQRTFICAEEPVPTRPTLWCSRSSPAFHVVTWANDPNEEKKSVYVEGLSKKLEAKWWNQGASCGMVSPDDETEQSEAVMVEPIPDSEPGHLPLASSGSWGHPELCFRPCSFFQVGLCRNGHTCSFCHLFHTERVKLDKRQRILLHKMEYREFMAYALQVIREKVQEITCDASELLHWLETEAGDADLPSIPDREKRKMSKVFDRMHLSNLLGLMRHKSLYHNESQLVGWQQLDLAIEKIRAQRTIPKE